MLGQRTGLGAQPGIESRLPAAGLGSREFNPRARVVQICARSPPPTSGKKELIKQVTKSWTVSVLGHLEYYKN